MSQKPQLSSLPTELLLYVVASLSARDLSSLSRLSHQFHRGFFHLVFDSAIAERSGSRPPEQCLVNLFFHAVKYDSTNVAQYLIYSTYRIDLNGSIQMRPLCSAKQHINRNAAHQSSIYRRSLLSCLVQDFTFLHFALLADAPKVAATLMKNGADISQELGDYPDLMPLYLTIPRSLSSSPEELDSALRIACSYALPKTVGFLLARGANANTTNKYGIAAIHTAVTRRHPWRELPIVDLLLSLECTEDVSRWESMLLQTVSALLDFGADIDVRTRTLRTHECNPKCWRSIDCEHQGQTALHIASATGILPIVTRLLDAGANPNLPDGEGYTALYAALVQGHKEIAYHILKVCDDPLNPIVYIPEKTTALHVACRFSFPDMVEKLLSHGAYANVIDSKGRTPLHDVLAWGRLDREEEVILTLTHLDKFGADPDTTANWQTPRQLAGTHASIRVRDIFLTLRERTQSRRTRRSLSICNLTLRDGVGTDIGVWQDADGLNLHDMGSFDVGISRHDAKDSNLPRDPFPHLFHPGKCPVETNICAATGQVDSALGNCARAPYKKTQLTTGFEASTGSLDQDDAQIGSIEQFPKLIADTSLDLTHTVATAAGIWAGTRTAQLIKGLEKPAPPPKRVAQLQKPIEAFPPLEEPGRLNEKTFVADMLNAEAAQFWGGLIERKGSAAEERVVESSRNPKEKRAKVVGAQTGRDPNKRRWTPVRL